MTNNSHSHAFVHSHTWYADDSTITCSSSNINEIENNLNTDLGRIYYWCVRNKLTINAHKTKSMLIGSKQKVCNTNLSVSIAGSSVVKVNYVKCLGVIIDESYHDNILNKCLKRAARIILQCTFLTP